MTSGRLLELAVVTSSRADFCHLYWPLHALRGSDVISTRLIAMGPHLSEDFGHTASAIETDGFAIDELVPCLANDDSDSGMAGTLSQAMSGFSELLARTRPDLLLVIADRYEMMAPACAALTLRIPIVHIEGGELSEGAIDNAVRNALTMMSHIHFTSTAKARDRVIAMGEEPWRVHHVGAPSLDHFRKTDLMGREDLGVHVRENSLLVGFHPVTLDQDTTAESVQMLAALEWALKRLDVQVIFCHPNTDAGGRWIADRMRALCADYPGQAHFFVNLKPRLYWSLMKQVSLLVGNSSSGIMESASVPVGAVNVGRRQQGRERGVNIIDVPARSDAIIAGIQKGLSPSFRSSIQGVKNIYGDGRSAMRIREVLEHLPDVSRLLNKQSTSLTGFSNRGKGTDANV